MFIRILNSEMELATGCTEPGAVALTAAEAGCALRRAGANTVEEVLVSASVNIIKNAMSAGIPGTSYEGMDYAAAIGAVGGDPVHLLEVMNYVAPEQVEQAAALVKAGKVEVEVAQVPQKLYVDVTVKGEGHTGRARGPGPAHQCGAGPAGRRDHAGQDERRGPVSGRTRPGAAGRDRRVPDREVHLGLLHGGA